MNTPFNLWVYLSASPLTWLGLTLAAYLVGDVLARRSGGHPLANPVLIAVILIAAVLVVSGTNYALYFEGAQFVHVLLGPATVALAVPVLRNREAIRQNWKAMLVAVLCGSVIGVTSAVVFGRLFGASELVVRSIAPKSVTGAIAMGISRENGGDPALTAVLLLFTGLTGAVTVTPLMNLLRIRDWKARGFAAGLAAHGIGTARALSVHPTAGTFAGLALALNGIVTALLAPLLLRLFG